MSSPHISVRERTSVRASRSSRAGERTDPGFGVAETTESSRRPCLPARPRTSFARPGKFLNWAAPALLLMACGEVLPGNEPEPGGKILFIGDSITLGFVGGGGLGYLRQIAARLPSRYEALNVAKLGMASDHWEPDSELYVERVVPVLDSGDVVAAVLMLGTNDVPRSTSPESYEATLSRITSSLLTSGAEHVYLMTPPPGRSPEEAARRLLESYRDILIALARGDDRIELAFDPFTMLDSSDYGLDAVHPAQSGHDKLAAGLWRALCPRLNACDTGVHEVAAPR